MAVGKDFLLKALLQHNYFPLQKKKKEEMPPVFNSSGLTKTISEEVRKVTLNRARTRAGFEAIQYKATRFNNVPRSLSIPHPKPYIDLCFEFYDNWDKIKHICFNPKSLIRPTTHKDGRTIIMDYETSVEKRDRYYKSAFGKKFLACADIANCFPSFYSHAISWALVGRTHAKNNQNPTLWFNKVDKFMRACSRNETSGVPIGPAISNIVCEIILGAVDKTFNNKKIQYVRYIDDYTAYCKTHKEAEDFIIQLSGELMKYKLNLNIKKTEIKSLPQGISEEWVGNIREALPKDKKISSSKVSHILDVAVRLQKNNPDGSILKYAANSIVRRLDDISAHEFVKYVIKLSFHYPVLIPVLYKPLQQIHEARVASFKKKLLFLLGDSIKYTRSDAACWLLYYLKIFHSDIPATMAERIIKWGDCMTLSLLAEFPTHQKKVIKFANNLDKNDWHELDSYWILLYQLFLKGEIKNPYIDKTFDVLKKNNVSFVRI